MWKRGFTKGSFNKLCSYIDLSFSDHGLLRIFWTSFSQISSNMYRCNQPYPYQLKLYKKKYKIKTVINLRGERNCSSFYLEKEYCENNNIKLYNFPISSRDLPTKSTIKEFFSLLDKVKYPAIMHCKSGADRAGIASCLYLIYKHKYSVLDATKQLSFKYLHIKYAKTGILDYLFETAIKKGKYSSSDFINWIDNDYSNQKLKKSFKPYKLFDFIVEKILKRE